MSRFLSDGEDSESALLNCPPGLVPDYLFLPFCNYDRLPRLGLVDMGSA